jgi:uncharacterized protein YjiS (DUF1127 family)
MTYVTSTRATGLSIAQRFADIRTRMADAAAKRKIYRTTVAELDGLGDRDLLDLGIHRSMIRSIAHEAAYGAK